MTTHGHKSRPRYEDNNHARLLTFSCYGRQPFLSSQRTCQWTCEAITRANTLHTFELWAFVLMPTHVHLLVWPTSPVCRILSSIKQSVANRAVSQARKHHPQTLDRMARHNPSGKTTYHFWQHGGGFDRNLWTPKHIFNAVDYIHMNPVQAGLCERPESWPWSSAQAYATHQSETSCDKAIPRVNLEHLPADPRRTKTL